jgi:hypothetical protein
MNAMHQLSGFPNRCANCAVIPLKIVDLAHHVVQGNPNCQYAHMPDILVGSHMRCFTSNIGPTASWPG